MTKFIYLIICISLPFFFSWGVAHFFDVQFEVVILFTTAFTFFYDYADRVWEEDEGSP